MVATSRSAFDPLAPDCRERGPGKFTGVPKILVVLRRLPFERVGAIGVDLRIGQHVDVELLAEHRVDIVDVEQGVVDRLPIFALLGEVEDIGAVELGHVVFDVLAVDHRLDLGRVGAFRLDDLDARQFLEGLEIGLALRVLQGPAIGAYAHRAAALELVGNRIDLGQFDIGRQRRSRKGEGLGQRRRGRCGQAVARGVCDELAPRIVGDMRWLPRHGSASACLIVSSILFPLRFHAV